jgi:DNA polymerase III alpha subunit
VRELEVLVLSGACDGLAPLSVLVATARRVRATGGRPMQFLTLEDESGLVEGVIFPDAYAAIGAVRGAGPFLVTGRATDGGGEAQIAIANVAPFHRRARPYA